MKSKCKITIFTVHLRVSFVFFFQAKPKLVEPIDYENVIVQRKTQIINDALREMLLFPYDDFQVIIQFPFD